MPPAAAPADEPEPRGLSEAEAARRLQAEGPNEPVPPRPRTPWRIALEVAREPMFQLLVAAGAVYLLLGDRGEALLLLGFVVAAAAITIVQERRTEKVLEALRDLSSPRALVLRDGVERRIAGREVVRGDLLRLAEGDRVPADAWLVQANDLQADESLLTGESVPVRKHAAAAAPAAAVPGGDGQPFVWAGTLLVAGRGLARVVATGPRSELGRIGAALGEVASPPTPLQVQTRRLVRLFSALGLALSAVVVVAHGLARGDWLGGLLAGIALAMSLLPQEFLLILTVFMAMGAWRLSRRRVLTRRPAAIEALGAATVLATDKTGTLTLNRMAVAELAPADGAAAWRAGDGGTPPAACHALLDAAVLASEVAPFDPMERALHGCAAAAGRVPPAAAGWTLVHEYALADTLPAMTHVWRPPGGGAHRVAVKGAPEAVLALARPDAATRRDAEAQAAALAGRGHRVLGVAEAVHEGEAWPDSPHGFRFVFRGFVALADPLRPGVAPAVQECRDAGIRVLMVTGDHPQTARAIAAEAGIGGDGEVLTGDALQAMDAAARRDAVARCAVFARVRPAQKLLLVEALQARGEVVAMTGDGVNDAPSLKAAHIGIAMGDRGTDVAREAASLVLLDDDFGSLVAAVRLGRRIDDNLRKAMAFVLAVHVPIAGLTLAPLALGWPLLLTPVHIAFLELLIDPVCSLAFEAEPEEPDLMRRPPRDPAAPLFAPALIAASLAQGALVLAAVAAFFFALLQLGVAEAAARAAAFAALVAGNAALIVANRARGGTLRALLRRPNPLLAQLLAAAAALLAAALFVPPLAALFRFAPPAPALLAAALGVGAALLLPLAWIARRRG